MKNKIELAKQEDVAQLASLCYTSFKESGLEGEYNVAFEKVIQEISDFVFEHIVLVKRNEENPKEIDGFIMLQFGIAWWTNEPFLTNLIFFVKPEKRTFSLARDLLSEVKKYAIMKDIPVVFDIFSKNDVQKKIKLLKYLGFKPYGTTLIFNPRED